MAAGIVTVGRKQYASGLYWENSPGGRIAQIAKEAARQPGNQVDFYAARSGNKQGRVPQFGLVQAAEGFRSGVPSLAGCLANQQPGSWIGAFRFREGAAVVVVRDDLIVPDGDRFFTDETEARDHLYQEMAVGGFQRIYAPEAWGVPGADTMPISLLLNDRTDVRLHPVALSKQAKAGLAIGLAVVLGVLAIGWYIQDQKAREEAVRLEQLEAMKRLQAEANRLVPGMGGEPQYPPPERKWEKAPRALELIKACKESLGEVEIGVGGWEIAAMTCNRSSLSVQWRRRGGFSRPPERFAVSDTGEQASSSVSLPKMEDRGHEDLANPDVITRRYLGQNWSGQIRREPDDPPPPPPPGYTGKWNPPPPPWVKRSFTFTVPVLPWTLPEFLADLPGVVITSISMMGSGADARGSWKVEGVIYENRR